MTDKRLLLRWASLYFVAPLSYSIVAVWSGVGGALAYFYTALAAALILLWIARRNAIPLSNVGLPRTIGVRDVLLGVGGFLVAGTLWPVFDTTFTAWGSSMFWNDEAPAALSLPPGVAALYYVGVLLLVPFAEEVWFRGYGLNILRERTVAPWLAIGFTSILFATLHLYGGPGFAAFIFVWSIVAGTLFHWTGRLWAPLIMHVLNITFAHVIVPLAFAD